MGAVARKSTITVCLTAMLAISPSLAANLQAEDSIDDPAAYVEETIELLSAEEGQEESRTWETAWVFAGLAEPAPTGPYDDPIPEDPIP